MGADSSRTWLWLFLLALAVRLLFVVVAPNNGTDAASRLEYAQMWLQHPTKLPPGSATDAWLPLHFWLLGSVLWLWHSEWSARLLTVFLGALTVLPYWGILRRAFERHVALAATFLFAIFGFHVAYSVTTSVEVPTAFFLASGIYFWMRFYLEKRWVWCPLAALAFSAAALCRFEPWVASPILGVLLLDFSNGWISLWSNRAAWLRTVCFGLMASAGALAWMVFSYVKWGDPMELPHRTAYLMRSQMLILRHSSPFRLVVVPVSLLASLSPLIAALAALGVFWVFWRGKPAARRIAVLSLCFFAANQLNAVRTENTQARYTLVYSWLLIPFAFEGLSWLVRRWTWADSRRAYAGLMGFFLLWQGVIIAGGLYGPPTMADRLGPMSPLLLPHDEIRHLTRWLKEHANDSNALIFDEFNYESGMIIQFAGINPSQAFQVRGPEYSDRSRRASLAARVRDFIRERRPRFAVCSPYGPIGELWSVDDHDEVSLPALEMSLRLQWQGAHWRVYRIDYPPAAGESGLEGGRATAATR
jgi:hypothetical protein